MTQPRQKADDSTYTENDLSTAAAPLITYCAIFGVCALCTLVVALVSCSPNDYSFITFAPFMATAVLSLFFGIIARGLRNENSWAWLPAAGFAVSLAGMFPIGTILSYYALTSLWKCRQSFFPFSNQVTQISESDRDLLNQGLK